MGDRPLAETDLVAQAKQGDTRAYQTLVEQHQTIAFRAAYLITGSEPVLANQPIADLHHPGRVEGPTR